MEWAKQRLRLRKVLPDFNMSHSMLVIVLVTCISHLVVSAEVKLEQSASLSNNNDRRSGGDNESNTGHPTHRPILHRSRGEDDVLGNVSSESKNDNAKEISDKLSGSDEVLKDRQQYRPLRLPHRRHQEEGEECDPTGDSQCKGSQTDEQNEFERIESILRDIFIDELDSQEDLHEPQNHLHNEEEESQDARDDVNSVISRHARSLEDEGTVEARAEGESRRLPKGTSHKASKKSSEETGQGRPHERNKKGGKVKGSPSGGKRSKATDLTKYNEYMDSVFRRMNSMIKTKKMDPLRVNLYAGPNKKQQPSKKKKKNNQARMNLEEEEGSDFDADDFDEDDDDHDGPARKDVFLNVSSHGDEHIDAVSSRKIRALLESVNGTTADFEEGDHSASGEPGSETPRATSKESSKNKRPKQGNRQKGNKNSKSKGNGNKGAAEGNKNSKGSKGGNKEGGKKKNGNKTGGTKPTRGVLHGLSSLKRDGNVAVIKQGEKARVVRANFLLGPVSLEIMPRKSKAGDSEKSVAATATAPKLKGVLEVRLKKGSPTRIRKLRVYPPKNVKVDGSSGSTASATASASKGSNKPRQYGKVTPMATLRLRQIASTVVRQADKAHTNLKQ